MTMEMQEEGAADEGKDEGKCLIFAHESISRYQVSAGVSSEMRLEIERPQPIPENGVSSPAAEGEHKSERTPLIERSHTEREAWAPPEALVQGQSSSIDSIGASSPGSRIVMTQEYASPAVPRSVSYRTPTSRLSMMRNSQAPVSSQSSTVTRPDHDDYLRRTAFMVHKHLTTCEQRELRRSLRAPSEETESRRHRKQASANFDEALYLEPKYTVNLYRLPILSLGYHFVSTRVPPLYHQPSNTDIYNYLVELFERAHLSSECSIVCLIYVERLMEKGKVAVLKNTWRPIVLCSMLLASKVWQDCASWNIEFAAIFPEYSLPAINLLERNFVSALGWDLYISQSVYARYYFGLRSLSAFSDFRRKFNFFVQRSTNERPRGALNVQRRSDRLAATLSQVLSRSF